MTAVASRFDAATLEILWSRLHGIAEEISWRSVARRSRQSSAPPWTTAARSWTPRAVSSCTPRARCRSSICRCRRITRDLMRRFEGRIYPGDVFIGNDPWLCCGHLPDVAIMTPVFRGERLVAFTTYVGAPGGPRWRPRAQPRPRGVRGGPLLPVMKLYERGERNETLFEMLRANVRTPEMVLGDIEAQVAANEVGARRLVALLDEYELATRRRSRRSCRGAPSGRCGRSSARLPDGTYRAAGCRTRREARQRSRWPSRSTVTSWSSTTLARRRSSIRRTELHPVLHHRRHPLRDQVHPGARTSRTTKARPGRSASPRPKAASSTARSRRR